jgi:5'-deoxynucleotidase YfbR-like HD superfamily hydrolase
MRAWQRMLSGRRLNLLEPSPLDIEIEDIAHGLSRVARWNGQTSGDWAYSVAQHSVLVETLVGRFRETAPVSWRLAALVHDAAEYVIGDLISPFKAAVGLDYKSFEIELQSAIHIRIGLPARLPDTAQKLIKRADRASAYLEATQLAGFEAAEAGKIFGKPRNLDGFVLKPKQAGEAKTAFLNQFEALSAAL